MRRGTTFGAAGTATASAVLVLVTTGCAGLGATACPAIAWGNTVAVEIPGSADPASGVTGVVVCQGADCAPGEPSPPVLPTAPGDATPGAAPVGPPSSDALSPTGDAARSLVLPAATPDGDVWSVPMSAGTGDRGRVAVVGADDRVLVERDARFTWVRHGGSEQCGGPSTARVVVRLP
ncbi:hypothetical protein QUG98_13160 [Curtobacterium sp. RHCJP20]|uniref:Uncharacterized protein n=1 Tax=Curtobacterium subtropicum TaxID=3055138 RepID=A0ABT7TIJ3_9MICO|nr:hypothetical protein [Curtobacterium subtropicum]MDM7889401.1 hypothetical protein [Curtobacterium subtropicum]